MITNGLIKGVPYVASPNHGGDLVDPTILVIHYTASGGSTGKSDAAFFANPAAKAAAHFVVGRSGDITQCVPTTLKAWHAGVSVWRGRKNCNDFSIGIEVDNYGYLLMDAKGALHPGANQHEVMTPSSAVKAKHKNLDVHYEWWESYAPKQMDALVSLTNQLLAEYPSITEIVGHEDIAPGRKIDPGPAFPWFNFRSRTDGRT